jgi:uncharacterized protein (DUF1330 family)
MPKGYWIVRADVSDLEQFKAYIQANAAPLKQHGARFLARAGQFEVPEGKTRSRNTLIEFPSYADDLACWQSPEYQAAIQLRKNCSELDIVIVEGYEGPQP